MRLKKILIALMLVIGTALMAQDKYEQAIVSQISGVEIRLSIEGQESKLEKIKPTVFSFDFAPLLKKVAELRNDGWEVWNSTTGMYGTTYFLRRKIK